MLPLDKKTCQLSHIFNDIFVRHDAIVAIEEINHFFQVKPTSVGDAECAYVPKKASVLAVVEIESKLGFTM